MTALALALASLAVAVAVVGCFGLLRRQKRIDRDIAAANEREVRYDEIGTELVYERSLEMERLVRWLALSFRVVNYRDDGTEVVAWNTPTFPKSDYWGEPMPEAATMERLYHEVVGPPARRRGLFGGWVST